MSLLVRLNKLGTEAGRRWLVGHPGADVRTWSHGADVSLSPRSGQESVSGAQWQFQKLLETGNKGVDLAVSCTRKFINALAAWRFKMSLAAKQPAERPHEWSGDVVLRMTTARDGADGPLADDSWEEHIMRGALVSVAPLLGGGESVNLSYSIKALHVEPYRSGRSGFLSGLVPAYNPPVAKLYVPRDVIPEEGYAPVYGQSFSVGAVTPLSGGGVVTVPWSGALPSGAGYTLDVRLWAVSHVPGEDAVSLPLLTFSDAVIYANLFTDLAYDPAVYAAEPSWLFSLPGVVTGMPGYQYANPLNAAINDRVDPEYDPEQTFALERGVDSVGHYVLVRWLPEVSDFTGEMRFELRARILYNGSETVVFEGVTTYLPRQTVEWRGHVLEERLLTLPGGVGVVLDRLYSGIQL